MIGIGAWSSVPVAKVKQGDEGMKGHIADRPAVYKPHPHQEHSVGYGNMNISHDKRDKGAEHHEFEGIR